MNVIRGFLWTLVSIMTLQGFLQADEYGSATTMIGGVSMTMSIWQESMSAATKSWFYAKPAFIGLPRALAQAAIKETALHPGIQVVPKLKATLKTHQHTWDLFREEEINWLLRHADLIGAVQSDPAAVALWIPWPDRLNHSQIALQRAQESVCSISVLSPGICEQATLDVTVYTRRVEYMRKAVDAWEDVLRISRYYSAQRWLTDIHESVNATQFNKIYTDLARLHDVDKPMDPRIKIVLAATRNMTVVDPWIQRLLWSLLEGEVWAACLEHVRLREGRIRELMFSAGIQDMINAHERILNASLRVVSTADEKRLVQEWFGEMSGYAWFLPDSLPSLVRRCVGQEAGDCTRIGPTEIVTLAEREVKRSQIVRDWARRLFIGMWNAMPVIIILFLLELVLICVPTRLGMPMQVAEPRTFVLKLEAPGGQERQMLITQT